MNRTTWLYVSTLALAACLGGSDDGGGPASEGNGRDTAKAAAQDLTKAMMMVNSEVKDGDIPDADAPDVSVTPADKTLNLLPGDADILPLGVDNPDEDTNPVAATLLQFDGASDHIRAESESDGTGVKNMFSISDGACDGLCNKVYTLTMYEAVELADGSVSERATQRIELDCTKDGDAKKCASKPGGGGDVDAGPPAPDPSSPAGKLKNSFDALSRELCMCQGSPCSPETTIFLDTDCAGRAFGGYQPAASEYLDCVNAEVQAGAQCIRDAMCDTAALDTCGWGEMLTGYDALDEACGAPPAGFEADVDACELAGARDGGVPVAQDAGPAASGCTAKEFQCGDDSCVPSSWVCDDAEDCPGGEDEQGC